MLAATLDAMSRLQIGGPGCPAAGQTSCTPTRLMIIAAAAGNAAPGASPHALPVVASKADSRLASTGGGVEHIFAWLNRFRRLAIRYERRADIHLAFTALACSLLRLNQIRRFR